MFCGKCGQQNADNTRFCVRCGNALTNMQQPRMNNYSNGQYNYNNRQPQPRQNYYQPNQMPANNYRPPAAVDNSMLLGFAALALAVFCGISIFLDVFAVTGFGSKASCSLWKFWDLIMDSDFVEAYIKIIYVLWILCFAYLAFNAAKCIFNFISANMQFNRTLTWSLKKVSSATYLVSIVSFVLVLIINYKLTDDFGLEPFTFSALFFIILVAALVIQFALVPALEKANYQKEHQK